MREGRINRAVAYPLTYLYVLGGYLITNHSGGWNPPHQLSMTAIDMGTPFLPWTGWIYVTVFPFPLLMICLLKEERGVRAALCAFIAVTTVCFIVFLNYPTIYPRPPWVGSGPVDWPLMLIRRCDLATNCWPSMHVTSAFLTAFYVRQYYPKLGAFLIFWAAVISASTLTTKQHYFWDVVAGVILSLAGHLVLHRYFEGKS